MMRLFVALFLLLLGSGSAFAQTVPPAGCTTTTCTGSVLPTGYLSVVGNQLQNSPGSNVRPACTVFRGLPTDNMAPIRNAGFNCIVIGWRDAYVGAAQTTWSPTDQIGMTLSNNNLTVTSGASGVSDGRSTVSKSTGKACWEITASTISGDFGAGLSNSSYVLGNAGGLGSDANGYGFFADKAPPNAQIAFYNGALLTSGAAAASTNGEKITECHDFDAQLDWITDSAMRTASGAGAWNNSGSCDPTNAGCGLSTAGLTGPLFIAYHNRETGGAVLNTTGPFAVALPSGFGFWDVAPNAPNGCNTIAQIAACVSSAQAANLAVIFNHLGNEVPGSTSACVKRQTNGLWFDQGGSSGNDDGCGDGHNWTYASFKANTAKLLQQFNGNPTVIGWEFHNEPLIQGAFTGTGGGGGGTGNFTVNAAGQVIDPNGAVWHGYGFNVLSDELSSATYADAVRLFPKFNFVRLAVAGDSSPGGWTQSPPNATLETWARSFTAHGVVVMIESHYATQPAANGLDLTGEFNWYKQLATDLKDDHFVIFESGNELSNPGVTAEHVNVYNAVRAAGNNTIVVFTSVDGNDFNHGGTPDGPASSYSNMTNVQWGQHFYNWMTGGSNDQNAVNNEVATSVNIGKSFAHSANGGGGSGSGTIGTLITEGGFIDYNNGCGGPNGPGTENNAFSCGTGQVVTAILNSANVGTNGGTFWLWFYTPCCAQQTDLVDRNSNPAAPFDTYGTIVQGLISSNSQGPVTVGPGAGNPPVNWGGSGDTDIKLACGDVGAAVNAVNPGVVLFCPGPINNTGTTLLNGTSKTISSVATNNVMDLSLAATKPVTGLPASKIAYSVHVYPDNVSGAIPDTPLATVTPIWNAYFGSLEKNGTAPVLNLATGCACDNSNGNLTDDQAFMGNWVAYANGLASGGPAFTGTQRPMGNAWYSWGTFSENPNGTLNSNGTLRGAATGQAGGQAFYWSQLLFSAAAQQTAWNGLDASAGITLSNNNQTATTTVASSQSVRATTAKSTGKACFSVAASGTITNDWTVGLSNSAYNLTLPTGLGGDTSGIGFDPNAPGNLQGIFYGNVKLSSGSATSLNGDVAMICADFDASRFWATSAAMRTAVGSSAWNNSATCDPTSAACAASFSGLTCPCFPTYNNLQTGSAAALGTQVVNLPYALPTGFSAWDPTATSGKPLIFIFGSNDNHPRPANDAWPQLALAERRPQ